MKFTYHDTRDRDINIQRRRRRLLSATHSSGYQIHNQLEIVTRYAYQCSVIKDTFPPTEKMPADESICAPRQSPYVLTFSKPTIELFEAALPTLKEESRQCVSPI